MHINLKDLMIERGINRNQLCVMTGATWKQINAIFNGKTSSISFDLLGKICDALNCTPNDILISSEKTHDHVEVKQPQDTNADFTYEDLYNHKNNPEIFNHVIVHAGHEKTDGLLENMIDMPKNAKVVYRKVSEDDKNTIYEPHIVVPKDSE